MNTGSNLSKRLNPFHDHTITVTNCGRICLGRRKINLSTVFAGPNPSQPALRARTTARGSRSIILRSVLAAPVGER